MKKIIIETKKLCKTFSTGSKQQHVIKNLDIQINQGDFTVIMGNSGSGKSTLLYSISGMDKPTLGEIYFEDKKISSLSNDGLAKFRRHNCGFVFQQIHLIDNMSVLDNIMISGLLINKNKKEVAGYAKELLKQVKLGEEVWGKFPSQVSGGEAQRAGIVRALINRPKILFADEPTGALNSSTSMAVLDALTEIHGNGQSVVMVTHDVKTASRGNRILYLRDGAVYGELHLDNYNEIEKKERLEKVQDFLDEMGW